MTIAASAHNPAFLHHLANSRSARLLHAELGRRWPESPDQLLSILRYALLPAGKLVRPIMTLYAAEAVGGDPRHVLPAALGMEYLHVATLVHDDIIDGDDLRRGRAAVPAAFGIPHAIVAGDHLIFSAFRSIVECGGAIPAAQVVAAAAELARAGEDLCRGQALESRLVGDPGSGVAPYLDMIRLKTGALFRAVCYIGAVLGGADDGLARRLARYGEHVGMAFQIRDDLLAYAVPVELTGKPATSDLTNGRPTLPVLLAHASGTPAQRQLLVDALNHGSGRDGDLARLRDLLVETSALDEAHARAIEQAALARAELSTLVPSESVEVLAGIARWVSGEVPEAEVS